MLIIFYAIRHVDAVLHPKYSTIEHGIYSFLKIEQLIKENVVFYREIF